MSESEQEKNSMLLAYDYGEIIQSYLSPPKKNSWINYMFKTIGITFSYLSLWEIIPALEHWGGLMVKWIQSLRMSGISDLNSRIHFWLKCKTKKKKNKKKTKNKKKNKKQQNKQTNKQKKKKKKMNVFHKSC